MEETYSKKIYKVQYNRTKELEKRREKEKERRYNLKQLFDKLKNAYNVKNNCQKMKFYKRARLI